MKHRCFDEKNKDYKNYGAKGIKVCDEWRYSFMSFLLYVGLAEHPDLTIDRIDSSKDYEPGNVRWATREMQNLNRWTTHTPAAVMRLDYLKDKYRAIS